MKVLGFDPGLAKMGWAVGDLSGGELSIGKLTIVSLGVWKTPPRGETHRRATDLGMRCDLLMQRYKPSLVFSEREENAGARALKVYRVCGALSLACALREIEYSEVGHREMRKELTGDPRAHNLQVRDAVAPLISLNAKEKLNKAHRFQERSTKRAIKDYAYDAVGYMLAGLRRIQLVGPNAIESGGNGHD